jgi:hypothetical protein
MARQDQLDKMSMVISQLEGVLKTTRNGEQKSRVQKQLREIRALYQQAAEGQELPASRLSKLGAAKGEPEAADVAVTTVPSVLDSVEVRAIIPECDDAEINRVHSYLVYFENEFWATMSDYHLKLDYNHSFTRDGFFNLLEGCKRSLKNYCDVLLETLRGGTNREYAEQLKNMHTRMRRGYLMEVNRFLKRIQEFSTELVNDHESGGNMILNPHDVLTFDRLEGRRSLEGVKIIDGIRMMREFTQDFLSFLSLPEM